MKDLFLFMFDSPMQIMLVIGALVLLFGAGKLPQLAKSLGQSRKAFKEGLRIVPSARAFIGSSLIVGWPQEEAPLNIGSVQGLFAYQLQ